MATKKCPKCGEENPAEAVMCWACYTPLAGGAAAVAGGGLVTPRGGAASVTPAASAAAQDEEKTPVDPKIFVVVGLLLAALVIGSFTTGLIGGSGGADNTVPDIEQFSGSTSGSGSGNPPPQPQQPLPVAPVAPPAPPVVTGSTGAKPPQFQTVVPPNPRQTTGVMGIIINTPNISPAQALSLAKFAKQTFESGGKWTGMQVVVFNNQEAAKTFLKYQAGRKGERLTAYEYQELANQGLWSSVPAYYETRGKTEVAYQPPLSNPKGWWGRGS